MKKSPLTIQCQQLRAGLIGRLIAGGKTCGHSGPYQLDCIEPRGAWHHITGSYQRIRFYIAEANRDNLQVLCVPCHQAKSRREAAVRRSLRSIQHDAHVKLRMLRMLEELYAKAPNKSWL